MDAPDHAANLADLTGKYQEAKRALEVARLALIDGLRAADKSGMRQADMVRAISHEWTREYVRKVTAKGDQGERDAGRNLGDDSPREN